MSDIGDIFNVGLTEDTVKMHDALNEKIRKNTMKIKIMTLLRDSLFNQEINVAEMQYWLHIIENSEKPDRAPYKKRPNTEISK